LGRPGRSSQRAHPGAQTIAGGIVNGTVTANLYHLFIKGTGGGGEPPAPFNATRFMPFL
jgi:hypothetical protein